MSCFFAVYACCLAQFVVTREACCHFVDSPVVCQYLSGDVKDQGALGSHP